MRMKRTVCLILLPVCLFALFSCNKTAATSEPETQTKNMERPVTAGIRVTFVGTSHGTPEANRKGFCTMLEVGGNLYFVDMGVSEMDTLVTKGIHVWNVRGVFVTNMHGDHTDGLVNFVDLASWCYSEFPSSPPPTATKSFSGETDEKKVLTNRIFRSTLCVYRKDTTSFYRGEREDAHGLKGICRLHSELPPCGLI